MKHKRSFSARSFYYRHFRYIKRNIGILPFPFYKRIKTPFQKFYSKSIAWTSLKRALSKRFYPAR